MTGTRKEASYISVATAVALMLAAISGGSWVGAIANDVETVKKEQVAQKEDHDRLIKVESKVENIEEDVKETKATVKANAKLLAEIITKLEKK